MNFSLSIEQVKKLRLNPSLQLRESYAVANNLFSSARKKSISNSDYIGKALCNLFQCVLSFMCMEDTEILLSKTTILDRWEFTFHERQLPMVERKCNSKSLNNQILKRESTSRR